MKQPFPAYKVVYSDSLCYNLTGDHTERLNQKEDFNMNIAIAGTGYVGLSIATLLSQNHHVEAVDIIPEKVGLINKRQSPIQDIMIEDYFAKKKLNLTATLDGERAYRQAEFVVIAAPTNYDPHKNFFDCSAVESVIDLVIKATADREVKPTSADGTANAGE